MFPRMLYRRMPDGEALDFENPKNTLTVFSLEELEKALDAGWLAHPLLSGADKDTADHESELKLLRAQIKASKKDVSVLSRVKKALGH